MAVSALRAGVTLIVSDVDGATGARYEVVVLVEVELDKRPASRFSTSSIRCSSARTKLRMSSERESRPFCMSLMSSTTAFPDWVAGVGKMMLEGSVPARRGCLCIGFLWMCRD